MAYTEHTRAFAVAEVRSTGSRDNGGFYDSTLGGSDQTQSDTGVLTLSDIATSGAGVNIITSVTGGFTANMVGNAVNIRSGTNFDVGPDGSSAYFITAVGSSNQATLDRSPTAAGAGSNGVGVVGGARATPGGAWANGISGNKVWVKGGAYLTGSTTVNVDAGVCKPAVGSGSAGPSTIYGYSTTRGDGCTGTRPVITAAVGAVMFDGTNGGVSFFDLDVTMATTASSVGFATGSNSEAIGCQATACVTGFRGTPGAFVFCLADTCTNGFGDGTAQVTVAYWCWARNCTSVGFTTAGNNSIMGCIASGCGSYGFTTNNSGVMVNCVAYGNGNSGFWKQNSNVARSMLFLNCISVGNTNYGFEDQSTVDVALRNCASYGNTVARSTGIAATLDVGAITLTGSPFIDAANGDFRLNNKGTGIACKVGGAYNVFPNYPNIKRNSYVGNLPTQQAAPLVVWPNAEGWPQNAG